MQMAVSRVIKLQHHRIAQCRTVKISILGDEGVPVQVDGEAWIQPPGYIRIVHKNRAQTLTRDRAFENTLKSWEDKQKCELSRPPSFSLHPEILSEEEATQMDQFGQAAGGLIHSIREIAQSHRAMEQELAHAVNASSKAMERVYGKPRTAEGLNCSFVLEMVNNIRALRSETELLLAGKMALQLDPPQKERLGAALIEMDQQLRKLTDTPWLCQPLEPGEEESLQQNVMLDLTKRSRSGKFRLVTKFKKEKNNKNKEVHSNLGGPVHLWGTEEVAAWLEHLSLCEYKDIFTRHDIRGSELLHLERRDLKDLGVTKVGHMKRILCGIKELSRSSPAAEA
nr:Dgkd protein [Mus musculus]